MNTIQTEEGAFELILELEKHGCKVVVESSGASRLVGRIKEIPQPLLEKITEYKEMIKRVIRSRDADFRRIIAVDTGEVYWSKKANDSADCYKELCRLCSLHPDILFGVQWLRISYGGEQWLTFVSKRGPGGSGNARYRE